MVELSTATPLQSNADCCGVGNQQSAKSCTAFSCLIVNQFAQSSDDNQMLKLKKHNMRANVNLSLESVMQSIVINTGAESTRGWHRTETSHECCLLFVVCLIVVQFVSV